MKRIFYAGGLRDTFNVDGDYFHYLKNVIRAKAGDHIGVLTADRFAECEIVNIDRRSAELSVLKERPVKEHDYSLKVYQCVLKREYMDFAVEKYAELGATEIVPVISERSLGELKDKTMQRYRDIALKAVLQSENEQMPDVSEAVQIKDVKADTQSNILFYEKCEEEVGVRAAKDMSIVIGPEGGFTDEEYRLLTAKGFTPVKPVSQILKAETASAVFTGYVRILQEQL